MYVQRYFCLPVASVNIHAPVDETLLLPHHYQGLFILPLMVKQSSAEVVLASVSPLAFTLDII